MCSDHFVTCKDDQHKSKDEEVSTLEEYEVDSDCDDAAAAADDDDNVDMMRVNET